MSPKIMDLVSICGADAFSNKCEVYISVVKLN